MLKFLSMNPDALLHNVFPFFSGFKCRCENLFCGLHRYSDQHDCTFDYKTEGRAKLEKDNPQVVGSKIRKI